MTDFSTPSVQDRAASVNGPGSALGPAARALDRYFAARCDLLRSILAAAEAQDELQQDSGLVLMTIPVMPDAIASDTRFLIAIANGLRRDILLLVLSGQYDRSKRRATAELARDRDALRSAAAEVIAALKGDAQHGAAPSRSVPDLHITVMETERG